MIDALVRPNVLRLKPYTSARHMHQAGMLLDANENAFGSVLKGPFKVALNRYPDPFAKTLKKSLAKTVRTSADRLFIGVGSDEVIELLIKLFVSPGENILIFEPTYGMYRVAADIAAVEVKSVRLDSDFQIDYEAFERVVTPKTKIVFCCSPNNPTGNLMDEKTIERLCDSSHRVVVVDEAYVEFARRPSLLKLLKQHENLVLLRTFSKAWGLAGLRVGYAITSPAIVDYLNKIKPPYNMNAVSAAFAVEALKKAKQVSIWKKQILKERQKLADAFSGFGFEVFPSEANFILIRTYKAGKIARVLAKRYGIIIRDVSDKPGLKDSLRITVGTPPQNRRLIRALESIR